MKNVEFYTFEADVYIRHNSGAIERFTEDNHEVVNSLLSRIETKYTEATIKALQKRYIKSRLNRLLYNFKMARGFCKCNFGVIDNVLDIDSRGEWHLEHVTCPLRGECEFEGVICHPTREVGISPAELRVIESLYNGMNRHEAADFNNISYCTCKKHIQNVRERHGFHDLAELFKYCAENELFKRK